MTSKFVEPLITNHDPPIEIQARTFVGIAPAIKTNSKKDVVDLVHLLVGNWSVVRWLSFMRRITLDTSFFGLFDFITRRLLVFAFSQIL